MKRNVILPILLIISILSNAQKQDIALVFDKPATHFTESLPIGNGRLGAMLFGKTDIDRIVLNEISLWSGGYQDADDPQAKNYLKQIQQLLLEGKNLEAQALLQKHFVSKGKGSCYGNGANCHYGCYQILAELLIDWKSNDYVKNYKRILDIENALATTSFERGENKITQTAFADFKNDLIWVKITANQPISLDVSLNRKENASVSYQKNQIILEGQLPNETEKGMQFSSIAEVISNGKITAFSDKLEINSAKEIVIKFSASTNYNHENGTLSSENTLENAQKYLNSEQNYQKAYNQSTKIYQNYFNRNRWTTNSAVKNENITTFERLKRYFNGEEDAFLPILYYNFGRYLLISSSREGLLPANLQGLWAEEYQTPWNGDYHLNINVQMNYWLAEQTNLSELTEPLHRFTKNLMPNGRKTARAYYDAEGWVAHVISNPWFFTSPGEGASWGSTLTGGAWLCQHIWEHYKFTKDVDFLRKYYEVLKESARFFEDILIKDPKTGYFVTAPSNSPENAYILPEMKDGKKQIGFTCMAPTMDMQIVRELISNTLQASEILALDKEKRKKWKEIIKNTAPNTIGKNGDLNEWLHDWDDAEPTHRHISHLYGLYPYDEITPWDTPKIAEAARKTLQQRGDGGTGWSMAWKINFWARLQNGNHALFLLKQLLKPVDNQKNRGGGTYANLFCSHPPFQIDGNFGGTAGISEMLLQSHGKNNVIRILPALPNNSDWENGKMTGMKARNGFQISFSWENHTLKEAEIISLRGEKCFLELPAGKEIYFNGKKIVRKQNKKQQVSFYTKVNGVYFIK